MLEWGTAGTGHASGFSFTTTMPCASSHTTAYQPLGKLDRGLDEAPKRGWTVVRMKKDWKGVVAFEK